MSRLGDCRRCGLPMEWARTDKGRNMPLDVDPSEGGNVVVEEIGGELRAHVLATPDAASVYRIQRNLPADAQRIAHFATCKKRPGRRS